MMYEISQILIDKLNKKVDMKTWFFIVNNII